MERRRDNKGRILHDGEMQMKDGRYRFKYTSWDGKSKVVYSWRWKHYVLITLGSLFQAYPRKVQQNI